MADRALFENNHSVGSIAVVMTGIMIALAIGWSIPLPWLDQGFVDQALARGGSSRLSIMLLGIDPLLSVFALGQVLILFVPKLEDRLGLVLSLRVLIFLFAFSDAYGVSYALLAVGQGGAYDDAHVPFIIATLVGGVAITLFLTGRLQLPLLSAGLWLVWLTGALEGVPRFVMRNFEFLRTDSIPVSDPVIAVGFSVAGLFLCMLAVRLLLKGTVISSTEETVPPACRNLLAIVVWPPFLAMIFAQHLTPFLSLEAFSFLMTDAIHPNSWVFGFHTFWTAVLIPAFVFLYWRYFDRRGCSLSPFATVFLAGSQVVVVTGLSVVGQNISTGPLFSGREILIIAAIWFAVADAVKRRPAAARLA